MPAKWNRPVFWFKFYEGEISCVSFILAVRDAPSVHAQRAEIEHGVRAGELSAVDGAALIQRLFVADLTRAPE